MEYLAAEAVRVPLGPQGSDIALHDGFGATLAARSKLFIVALRAISFTILLMETIGSKMLTTQRAKEVLRMPSLVQGSHATLEEKEEEEEKLESTCFRSFITHIQDWSIAVGTAWCEQLVVVLLTVWLPIVLIECDVAQLLVTLGASEVLRMPRPSHGIDDLAQYGLITGCTCALSRSVNTLTGHVQLKRAEHVIKISHPLRLGLGFGLLCPAPAIL